MRESLSMERIRQWGEGLGTKGGGVRHGGGASRIILSQSRELLEGSQSHIGRSEL